MEVRINTLPIVVTTLIMIFTGQLTAQEEHITKKKFFDEKVVWTTQEKSQGETGLCAIFSDISFLESELHRLGRGDFELSTMFVAYYFYIEKALRRIRLRGKVDFGFHAGFNYDAF